MQIRLIDMEENVLDYDSIKGSLNFGMVMAELQEALETIYSISPFPRQRLLYR